MDDIKKLDDKQREDRKFLDIKQLELREIRDTIKREGRAIHDKTRNCSSYLKYYNDTEKAIPRIQ